MISFVAKPDFGRQTPALPARGARALFQALGQAAGRTGGWIRQRLEPARYRRAPSLRLELPERVVQFRSLREFGFALNGRTDFPARRMAELMRCRPADLEAAAAGIRDIEHHFARTLTRAMREPELMGEYFRELDLKLFSEDHGWRRIMEGLSRLSPEYDVYKHLALVRYMQYLRSRQEMLRRVFLAKERDAENAEPQALHTPPHAAASQQVDTHLFHRDSNLRDDAGVSYGMLPKGETVHVHLGQARQLELLLAGTHMRLFTGRQSHMVDDGGSTHPLAPGKNLVGRHSGCDVVVDAACRAVSRTHLLVEVLSEAEVLLTDLSSHGTAVPAELLPPR